MQVHIGCLRCIALTTKSPRTFVPGCETKDRTCISGTTRGEIAPGLVATYIRLLKNLLAHCCAFFISFQTTEAALVSPTPTNAAELEVIVTDANTAANGASAGPSPPTSEGKPKLRRNRCVGWRGCG